MQRDTDAPSHPFDVRSERRFADPKTIGEGGLGLVSAVFDPRLGRQVAYKTLKTVRTTAVDRFVREARVTAQLEHPGIVPVHDAGRRADGTWYYTMKFVRGRSLSEAIRDCDTLEQRLALLDRFRDVCNAIAYAHSRGVVHRDLKPANVMVGEFGETLVVDWGLAKLQDEAEVTDERTSLGASASETVTGQVMGTPSYMSPEQAHGRITEIDERSDVWGLGAILYEILTGKPPFYGDAAVLVLEQVRRDRVPPVRSRQPDVPQDLAAIAEKALMRERQDRYTDAGALARDVDAFLSGALVAAYEYSTREQVLRWVRNHRASVATAALGLAAALATAVVGYSETLAERDRAVAAEGEAVQLLAGSFADRAVDELARSKASAALYAAASLTRVENPRARGALAAARAGWYASLKWVRPVDGCRSPTVSADGLSVACVGADAVTVRSAQDWSERWTLQGRWTRAAFNGDDTRLAVGTKSQVVELDARDGSELARHDAPADTLVYMPDNRILAIRNQSLSWITPGSEVRSDRLCTQNASDLDLSIHGHVAVACTEGIVHIYDAASGAPTRVLAGVPVALWRARWSPDGTRLLFASLDTQPQVWSVGADAALLFTLDGHVVPPREVIWSGDGRHIATSGADRTARLWEGDTGQALETLPTDGLLPSVQFLGNQTLLTSGHESEQVRAWTLPEHRRAVLLHEHGLSALSTSADQLVTLTGGGRLRAFDAATGMERHAETLSDHVVMAGQFSPDGTRFAVTTRAPNGMAIFDTSTWQRTNTLPLERGLRDLLWSRSGQSLLTYDYGARIEVYGTSSWTIDQSLQDLPDPLAQGPWTAMAAGRSWWASFEGDQMTFWDARVEPAKRGATHVLPSEPTTLAFSPSDEHVVLALEDRSVRVRARGSETDLAVLWGHEHLIASSVFIDEDTVATGSIDRTIRVWNWREQRLVATLRGHEHRVSALATTRDLLWSSGWDHTARAWDLSALDAEPARIIAELRGRYGIALRGTEVEFVGAQ